ncbi:succinyl-diaminopimelate desuccinylase [Thalassospira lucentensis]|uniref:succinyl-diaminopimelate desuccinylase n=1 Tax=Thalassospira lucentensis TaxID=168935 RepID=UPI0003B4695F|nr:succinyl-diaminopimelate desuccinylase [Thalassospira lucentensis]RCK26975.1 succinyl-diaminopimelate desuccinylase [Thalassospira lucentensis MCCC 1A00383 = DSM 14000]
MSVALELAQSLIRCPSVTPADAGALDVLQQALEARGFDCKRKVFDGNGSDAIDNLYARLGTKGRNFCFAGHTDVVPAGDRDAWTVDPFGGEVQDGRLFGRGAVDMKTGIACFVGGVDAFLAAHPDFDESISFLITGDEEADAFNGTVRLIEWCDQQGEKFDTCLVGEPTNPKYLGEMMKIGRRGSITGWLTIYGAQGHVAYPHLADNPVPRMIKVLDVLNSRKLDQGTDHFQPSNLEVTTVDAGNSATNVVPAKVSAAFNIRFNDLHTGVDLEKWIKDVCAEHAGAHELRVKISGDAFLSTPGKLANLIADAAQKVTGKRPEMSTTGGTSDARFIQKYCEVAEFGLVGQSMHKVDEHAMVEDIENLSKIYSEVLSGYFNHS